MRRLLGLAALAACGEPAAHVQLVPVTTGCGPTGGTSLIVSALGDGPDDARAVDRGAPVAIDDFPSGTRQLQVEVLGGGGSVVGFGRTAPLDWGGLADGETIPILMAPPDDGCPVSGLAEPRDQPIVIAAGDGALVVGGIGPDGPSGTAEWYDPATGGFTAIDTPQALQGPEGAAGMVAATMPDGRIVLTGGARPIYVVFDPATRTFAPPGALFELRAHHAAVALDARRVLVAGGCGMLEADGSCTAGTERRSSFIVDIGDGSIADGPDLALARLDGSAFFEGGAAPRVLLVGGGADAERIDPGKQPGQGTGDVIAGTGALAAPLASGSVVTAFGAAGEVGVVVPGVATVRAQPAATPRPGAAMATLEDGGVLVVGGATTAARYHPTTGTIDGLDAMPPAAAGAGVARLPDGTVLVAGGRDAGGAPLPDAWIFRPAGPSRWSGAASVTPDPSAELPLVPRDPAATALEAIDYVITSSGDDLAERVVIAGMAPRELDLDASVTVAGGVAILLGIVDPDHLDAIELVPGETARLVRSDTGATCAGASIAAGDLAGRVAIAAHLRGSDLRVTLGGHQVLDCPIDAREGLVGLAALGDGATVTLSTISVTR